MYTDVKQLVLTIVKPLVAYPEQVSLSERDGEEFLEYHLSVSESDIGRVIGKQGRIIQAIRTLVYSVPVQGKKIRLLIEE